MVSLIGRSASPTGLLFSGMRLGFLSSHSWPRVAAGRDTGDGRSESGLSAAFLKVASFQQPEPAPGADAVPG